jgi:hypothetical protein
MSPVKAVAKNVNKFSTGGLNRPLKMVKMVQARCNKCNPRGQGKRGWWDSCPHNPYVTVREEQIVIPTLEQTEDGRTLKTGETIEIEYHEEPNWKQVADDPKVSSGRMVQIQKERGSKFPEELGYPSICDYNNCWELNPKIRAQRVIEHEGVQTIVGNYHTRDEAAIMTLRTEGVPIYVGVGKDINLRRAQLDAVNIPGA